MDFWRPLRPETSDVRLLQLARLSTIGWGVILFSVGLAARHWGSVLETGLTIASILYGSLLGVFLLGVLTKRPGEWAAIAGMSAGLIATVALRTQVAYTWYVLIGSLTTFVVGYLAGFVLPNSLPALDRE